jgi:hypothetical protein
MPRTTWTETYTNPKLNGPMGARYRRMHRYLSSIGELLLTRHVCVPAPPSKYEFDEQGGLIFANLDESDIKAHLDCITKPR